MPFSKAETALLAKDLPPRKLPSAYLSHGQYLLVSVVCMLSRSLRSVLSVIASAARISFGVAWQVNRSASSPLTVGAAHGPRESVGHAATARPG